MDNIKNFNVTQLFLVAAKKYPLEISIIEKDKSITYSQLEDEVKKTAAYFQQKGIKRGDRVLVFIPMGIHLYRIVLALFYLGATAVFLDAWVSKKRMEICCKIANCRGFIGTPKARLFSLLSKELRRIPIKLNQNKIAAHSIAQEQVEWEDSALITFTTGSSGVPKAADRSHGFLMEQFNALKDEIKPNTSDVDMPVLPIVLFVNLGIGCTSVIADFKMTKPNSLNGATIYEQLKKNKVNRITASPFFIKKLSEYLIESNSKLEQIEKIFTGGAPVFQKEAGIYNSAFPTSQINIVYGSTEAEPISSIDSKELALRTDIYQKGLPVGEIYHKTELKIIPINNSPIDCTSIELDEMELKEGKIGEIIVSGPHVLKKYFNNIEAFHRNKIVIDEKIWHRTGDSGFLLNNGLSLTGLCKQLIIQDKGYISPFIIENKLQNIDGIKEGTILSMNKKVLLIVQSTLSKNRIKELTQDTDYDQIIIVKQIPKDPRHNSKIDYNLLKKQLIKNKSSYSHPNLT